MYISVKFWRLATDENITMIFSMRLDKGIIS